MYVEAEKLGMDLTGVDVTHVCMTEAVEHVQCVLPGVAGGIYVAKGMVRIAKIIVADGLAVAVGEFGPQVERLPVVGHCLLVMAKVMVGISYTVQGVALTPAVAYLLI